MSDIRDFKSSWSSYRSVKKVEHNWVKYMCKFHSVVLGWNFREI